MRGAGVAELLAGMRRIGEVADQATRLAYCQDLHALACGHDGYEPNALATVRLLRALSPEEQDYCVATGYALMMGGEERQRLGVFLTPPPLVEALLAAMKEHGLDLRKHSIVDPAAGGAAFVVPLARRMLALSEGRDAATRLIDLRRRLHGIEIEHGLGRLANRMVERVVRDALGTQLVEAAAVALVREGDALEPGTEATFDAVIGNPPYGRLSADEFAAWRRVYPELAQNGHLNWYALFVRRSLDLLRPGGLLGFVLPTSFIGSPSYEGFRRSICLMADVIRIDHIDQRQDLFESVQQDCCILILRRRAKSDAPRVACNLGYLAGDGLYHAGGAFEAATDGGAWMMACGPLHARPEVGHSAVTTLAALGWKGKVGSVVPHRAGGVLFDGPDEVGCIEQGKSLVRVLWSKAITSDGHLDMSRMKDLKQTYALCKSDSAALIRSASIVAQRTSNKHQNRRINTAVLDISMIGTDGILAENHVIAITPPRPLPEDHLRLWSMLLSGEHFDRLFKERSGTVTVSVKLLMNLPFPVSWIPQVTSKTSLNFPSREGEIEHVSERCSCHALHTATEIPTTSP